MLGRKLWEMPCEQSYLFSGIYFRRCMFYSVKGTGKVHPRTGHEGPEWGVEV